MLGSPIFGFSRTFDDRGFPILARALNTARILDHSVWKVATFIEIAGEPLLHDHFHSATKFGNTPGRIIVADHAPLLSVR